MKKPTLYKLLYTSLLMPTLAFAMDKDKEVTATPTKPKEVVQIDTPKKEVVTLQLQLSNGSNLDTPEKTAIESKIKVRQTVVTTSDLQTTAQKKVEKLPLSEKVKESLVKKEVDQKKGQVRRDIARQDAKFDHEAQLEKLARLHKETEEKGEEERQKLAQETQKVSKIAETIESEHVSLGKKVQELDALLIQLGQERETLNTKIKEAEEAGTALQQYTDSELEGLRTELELKDKEIQDAETKLQQTSFLLQAEKHTNGELTKDKETLQKSYEELKTVVERTGANNITITTPPSQNSTKVNNSNSAGTSAPVINLTTPVSNNSTPTVQPEQNVTGQTPQQPTTGGGRKRAELNANTEETKEKK